MKSKGIYIGIDPGVDTGVCVWDADQQTILRLDTLGFWSVIGLLSAYKNQHGELLSVVIEDPNLNKAMHWQQKKSVRGFNPATKIAQNVGQNKKEAELIIKYLEANQFSYEAIRPVTRKIGARVFKHLSGYKDRTNQHVRDAAMLVINR